LWACWRRYGLVSPASRFVWRGASSDIRAIVAVGPVATGAPCQDVAMQSLVGVSRIVGRQTTAFVVIALTATLATFLLRVGSASSVVVFVVSAVALACLATVVGSGTDQIGARLGPGLTGVLQGALGNLPELFISLFALQAGLVVVVKTALVGSILANSLLVLGLAFFFGGLRHGVQKFSADNTRLISTLLVLAVAAILIPTLATQPGAPDEGHARDLSEICALVLIVVFIGSIPFSIRGASGKRAAAAPAAEVIAPESEADGETEAVWPLSVSIGLLAGSAILAALVADWFIEALRPAMASLGIAEEFAGLVIVAIAGNAVENAAGVRLAMKNKIDLAVSLIQNSSLQVALALTPALVIASGFIGPVPMTLVLSPLLVAALGLSAILGALVVIDGESSWLEGLALVGLYVIIAASVWWGHTIVL
jgi:Ca2+:H+ antiporter